MAVTESERARREALLERHYAVENAGDLAGIMATFAPDAVMHYNGVPFSTPEAIEAAHAYLGFADVAGAFDNPQNHIDRVSHTDTDVVVEGRLSGAHVQDFLGFAGTGSPVVLPFTAFYCYGHDGLLTSERVVMNLGPLNPDFVGAPAGLG
ncbi:MAG TPA: nuclear transport factor 2 family protein [Aeromicrobium sp.]|nr:nuclear transport factor 2 family protein [Aeromicrobium sp.]